MPIIRTTGDVTVYDDTFFTKVPPVVVGAAPQWNDGSDATYAELETFQHWDVSFADTAFGRLDNAPVTQNADRASVTARVRYSSLSADMARPLAAVSTQTGLDGLSSELLVNLELEDVPGSPSATWVDIPLRPAGTGSAMQVFLDRMNAGDPLYLQVRGPLLFGFQSNPRTRVYEAYLIVTGSTVAPPCRLYPADTQGSVGGPVRQYPPSKSRQRSSRGVGYY